MISGPHNEQIPSGEGGRAAARSVAKTNKSRRSVRNSANACRAAAPLPAPRAPSRNTATTRPQHMSIADFDAVTHKFVLVQLVVLSVSVVLDFNP